MLKKCGIMDKLAWTGSIKADWLSHAHIKTHGCFTYASLGKKLGRTAASSSSVAAAVSEKIVEKVGKCQKEREEYSGIAVQ